MATQRIIIADIVGTGICVSVDDGIRVYDAVRALLKKDQQVTVSFAGVTRTTTAFLNAALGQLYGEFDDQFIRRHVDFADLDEGSADMIGRVVDRAKRFFRDRERISSITRRAVEEQ